MSTPTPEVPFQRPQALPRSKQPRWMRRGLSPVRGLLYIALILAALIAIGLNYELVWEALAEFVPWAFYFGADVVVGAFELVGMAPGAAGTAAVYIGVVVFLVLLYFLARRAMLWNRLARELLNDYRAMYAYYLRYGFTIWRATFIAWWEGLDILGKAAVIVGAIVILVPLMVGLSIGLGMLVALLI